MDLLLDANFLVLPFQFNLSLADEFERLVGAKYSLYTLERTYHEARDLDDGRYSSLVRELIDVMDISLINTEASVTVDEQLVTYAQDGFVVCTNDRELREQLRDERLPCIFLRQRNHLEAERLRI